MEAFVADLERSAEGHAPKKFEDFKATLTKVGAHPNARYFALKSIILNNLFGVDIMEEAVEICKLRLFLELAAQVEPDTIKENLGIEPLPDIDFNIRAGNTLVGYANYDEVKTVGASKLDLDNAMEKIGVRAADLQETFDLFRRRQTEGDGSVPVEQKLELRQRLKALEDELNHHLAAEHGVKISEKSIYAKWVKTHQPFHWFVEFYGIMTAGGFDVIIGNPPYVEYPKVQSNYRVLGFVTLPTNNLFALVAERSRALLNRVGRIGLILPNSSVSAEKMRPLQQILLSNARCWISNYAWRPSKLFEGANMLLAIWIVCQDNLGACFSTRYHRWSAEFRDHLFPTLQYSEVSALVSDFRIPKLPDQVAARIFEKCRTLAGTHTLNRFVTTGRNKLYYFRAVLYWFKVLIKPPVMEEDGIQTPTGEMKELGFDSKAERDAALCLMASNLFAMNYVIWSSCQVVNSPDLMFPVNLKTLTDIFGEKISELANHLMKDVHGRSKIQTRQYSARSRTFTMRKQYFFFKESKSIIDDIDQVLAQHYGFTEQELDYIINYDIKYRLGQEAENEEDE